MAEDALDFADVPDIAAVVRHAWGETEPSRPLVAIHDDMEHVVTQDADGTSYLVPVAIGASVDFGTPTRAPVGASAPAEEAITLPNPDPTIIHAAAQVSVDDVRTAYYRQAPQQAWIREFHTSPQRLIVANDGDGSVARIDFDIADDGTIQFGQPKKVRVEYVEDPEPDKVAASRMVYASAAESRPATALPPGFEPKGVEAAGDAWKRQPRDGDGQWTDTPGGGGSPFAPMPPVTPAERRGVRRRVPLRPGNAPGEGAADVPLSERGFRWGDSDPMDRPSTSSRPRRQRRSSTPTPAESRDLDDLDFREDQMRADQFDLDQRERDRARQPADGGTQPQAPSRPRMTRPEAREAMVDLAGRADAEPFRNVDPSNIANPRGPEQVDLDRFISMMAGIEQADWDRNRGPMFTDRHREALWQVAQRIPREAAPNDLAAWNALEKARAFRFGSPTGRPERSEINASADPHKPPAAEPDQPTKEDDMSLTEVRQRLGLADDADETVVLAAIDDIKAKADTAPDPKQVAAAVAEKDELTKEVGVLKGQVEAMSAKLADTEAKKAAEIKASVLDTAQAEGKFLPAQRDQWEQDYEAAPAAVTRVLASIAVGTAVPVNPLGKVGDPQDVAASEEDEDERIFRKLEPAGVGATGEDN